MSDKLTAAADRLIRRLIVVCHWFADCIAGIIAGMAAGFDKLLNG